MRTLLERIAGKYRVDVNGCWLWCKTLDEGGYGRLIVRGKQSKAHRVSYVAHKGPIPEGLVPDHTCRVRSCINPEHLEPVTHAVNTQRGLAGALYPHPTHCPAGHEYSGENTRFNRGWRVCRTCHRERERKRRTA